MRGKILFRACLWSVLFFCLMAVFTGFSNPQDNKLDRIRAAIKAKDAQWTPGETPLTRLSIEQLRRMMGDRSREIAGQEPIEPRVTDSIPESIDWRNVEGHNYVTSVKDQTKECGSCVAFDAVATLESLICIEEERPDEDFDLSEMDIFMCGGGICSYGWANGSACLYMDYYGVPDEYCWPYVPEDTSCDQSCSNKALRAVQIDDAGFILGPDYKAAISFAPIMTTMKVYDDFASYRGGIYEYDGISEFLGMHSICIIGYDKLGETEYWIVKNSWGTTWGEGGYAKIKMGECMIEAGAYWISGAILPSVPVAPTGLDAGIEYGCVQLDWEDSSNNEMLFAIDRKLGTGEFITIAEIPVELIFLS